MEEIRDVTDLRENVRSFREAWQQSPDLMRQLGLLRSARYWIYDPNTGDFANAKFAGYRDMTVNKYARAREGNFEGNFTGGVNALIARRLRQEWREDEELSETLVEFARQFAGPDILAGVKRSKWRFVVLPSENAPTSRTRPSRDSLPPGDPDKEAEIEGLEGGKRIVTHVRMERNSGLVSDVKERWLAEDPDLSCVVCGFSFQRTYGRLGDGFIEAHHQEALASRGRRSISREQDFDRVCSNCHRMLHRMGDDMSASRLKKIVESRCGGEKRASGGKRASQFEA